MGNRVRFHIETCDIKTQDVVWKETKNTRYPGKDEYMNIHELHEFNKIEFLPIGKH